jgi:hypothetical protein
MVSKMDKIVTIMNDRMTRVFTEPTALLDELTSELLNYELGNLHPTEWNVEEWNNMGDRYRIEPTYAPACAMYEAIKSPLFTLLAERYGMEYKEYRLKDFNVDNEADAAFVHDMLGEMAHIRDNLRGVMSSRLPSRGFRYTLRGFNRRTGEEWSEKFDIRVIDMANLNKTTYQLDIEEHYEWYNSKEGKAERKAEAERQQDLMWYKMENGLWCD